MNGHTDDDENDLGLLKKELKFWKKLELTISNHLESVVFSMPNVSFCLTTFLKPPTDLR